jgi:hypothetical protein
LFTDVFRRDEVSRYHRVSISGHSLGPNIDYIHQIVRSLQKHREKKY